MKCRHLREIVPAVASVALISLAYFNERVLAEGNNEKVDETNMDAKYINDNFVLEENELIILNLDENDMSNYDMINSNEIESITYSNSKASITINLKDTNMYYSGYYDELCQKYIYIKSKNKVYSIK